MAFGKKQQPQGFGAQPGQQLYNQPAPKKKKESESLTAQVKRQATITSIAVVIAILASVFAGFSFVNAQMKANEMAANTIPVVVVTEDIPLGGEIDDTNIGLVSIPQAYLNSQVITGEQLEADPMSVFGHTAVTTLPAGTQLTPNLVSGSGNVSSLANVLESNHVAVTIGIGTESGVAGMLKIGDYVNVTLPIESISGQGNVETIVEKVKVVALDGWLTNPEEGYGSVTLEVTPEQSAKIRSAQLRGALYLVLLSSADLDEEEHGSYAQQEEVEEGFSES